MIKLVLDSNITKVGSSLYVLIPNFIAEQYGLENGDIVEMSIEGDTVVIRIRNKNLRSKEEK